MSTPIKAPNKTAANQVANHSRNQGFRLFIKPDVTELELSLSCFQKSTINVMSQGKTTRKKKSVMSKTKQPLAALEISDRFSGITTIGGGKLGG